MQTKVSSKGQVVLPVAVRALLNLRPGDPLNVLVENERIILVPKQRKKRKARIIKDPITGMPVLTLGPGAPKITSEWVAKMLEDFP
jgi:AbrB family looped-hinge helix DNA binding protein